MLEPTIAAGTRHSLRCVCPANPAGSIFTCLKQASFSVAAHGHRVPDACSGTLVQLSVLRWAVRLLVGLLKGAQALRCSLRGHSPFLALQHSKFHI